MTCSAVKKNVKILLTLKGKINIKKKKKEKHSRESRVIGSMSLVTTNADKF